MHNKKLSDSGKYNVLQRTMKFFFTTFFLFFFLFGKLLFFSNFSFGQSIDFKKEFPVLTDDLPFHLDVSESGVFFISGSISSFVSEDCYISKHDSAGGFIWGKMIGGTGFDFFQKAMQKDSIVFCAGNTNSFGSAFQDFYMVALNPGGDTLWSRVLGGGKYDRLMDFAFSDKNLLLCGFSNSFGLENNNDILLIYTDSSGVPQWAKTFVANGDEVPHSVIKTSDMGFLIVGNTTSFGGGMKDIFCLKTDSAGNFLWLKSFGGTADDDAVSAVEVNGSFFISGSTRSLSGTQDLLIINLDSSGDVVWNKVIDFGLDEKGNSVFFRNGKVYICGYLQSFSGTQDDIFVLSFDTGGNNFSARYFPSAGSEYGNFIGEVQGHLLAGGIKPAGNSMKISEIDDSLFSCNSSVIAYDTLPSLVSSADTFFSDNFIPVDSIFVSGGGDFSDVGSALVTAEVCMIQQDTTYVHESGFQNPCPGLRVYPNPGSGRFFLSGFCFTEFHVQLINRVGEVVFSSDFDAGPEAKEIELEFETDFPPGVYFFQATWDEHRLTGKIIIQDF